MSDYKLPIIEPTIDYTKVPPINQKRTISFINHFIIHTVTFLNKFALSCEEKLFEFENKLQRVEASLEILESWLSSVPSLYKNQERDEPVNQAAEDKSDRPIESATSKIDESNNVEDSNRPRTVEEPPNRDPRYEKYFKMVQVGVPREALKLKMEQEGLDSSILDEHQQVGAKGKLTDTAENKGN